jgi:hypothetical protein
LMCARYFMQPTIKPNRPILPTPNSHPRSSPLCSVCRAIPPSSPLAVCVELSPHSLPFYSLPLQCVSSFLEKLKARQGSVGSAPLVGPAASRGGANRKARSLRTLFAPFSNPFCILFRISFVSFLHLFALPSLPCRHRSHQPGLRWAQSRRRARTNRRSRLSRANWRRRASPRGSC